MSEEKNILIVDDEILIAMGLRAELGEAGFASCQIEASGEKALGAALHTRFDAILMDLNLGGKIGGLEAVRQMRAAGVSTPIVFISGYGDAEHRQQAAEFEAASYLVKPINMAELVTLLRDQFSHK